MARQIEILGLPAFTRELAAARQALPHELHQADAEAARLVAAGARRRAPRGPHQGGGTITPIVASIQAGVGGRGGYVQIGGASTPHAEVYEFGGTIPRRGRHAPTVATARARHRSFASAGVGSVTHVTAQPYVYPTIAAERGNIDGIYLDALERAVRSAFPGRGLARAS